MTPRFMQRLQRQSDTLKQVFGEPQFDPPPYHYPDSRRTSTATASSVPDSSSIISSTASAAPPPSYRRATRLYSLHETPCLPKGALVLVIGANGWLGSHVVDQLLSSGYRVRGAVRDDNKALWTSKLFSDKYGPDRYSSCVVPDMTVPGAYLNAVKGCSGVVHAASVTTLSPDPREVIPPTIMGALNALEDASKEPRVRRFVYCSSVTAAANIGAGARSDVTSESWNMAAFKAAWEPPPYEPNRAWTVFASSKMQAEQAVWKWYREKKPHFILNCVLPGMLFGRAVASQHLASGLSMHVLKSIYDGQARNVAWTPPQHCADVEDAALVLVAALILPGVMSERLFVAALPYNINSLLDLIRALYPDRNITGWDGDHGVDQTRYLEANRAEELLRRLGRKGWTDVETSIGQACEQFA